MIGNLTAGSLSSDFVAPPALTVDYVIVAGGGGGGYNLSGGGGAGGLRSTVTATGGGGSLETALSLSISTNYSVIIGGGGNGGAVGVGDSGVDSSFATITATGGGGGGGYNGYAATGGGSGGGGAFDTQSPKLCAAGVQLRDQVDTWFPDRRTASDGWVGDSRHAARKSDHNPDEMDGSEQLILILAWVHPKGSVLMWLTRSESLAKPINVYLTSSITDTSLARY
jgi:hypothetical protein